jgi:hypothetical protein
MNKMLGVWEFLGLRLVAQRRYVSRNCRPKGIVPQEEYFI